MRYQSPVTPIPLNVGQQVHLAGDPNPWTVKAVSENFAALIRTFFDSHVDPSWPKNFYTVIDWRNGVRGLSSAHGDKYGSGDYTEAECAAMLAEFEAGELEVSHRNQVPIRFGETTW